MWKKPYHDIGSGNGVFEFLPNVTKPLPEPILNAEVLIPINVLRINFFFNLWALFIPEYEPWSKHILSNFWKQCLWLKLDGGQTKCLINYGSQNVKIVWRPLQRNHVA